MGNNFKVGDKVICIDNYMVENELDLYSIYTVTWGAGDGIHKNRFIELHETLSNWSYREDRFILATEENILLYIT